MAEFTADLQSLRFPFLDIDNMEIQNFMMPFSCESFLGSPEAEFPGNLLEENFPALVQCVDHNEVPVLVPIINSVKNEIHEGQKRKATDIWEPSSANSTPAVFESGSKTKNVDFLHLVHFIIFFMHSFLHIYDTVIDVLFVLHVFRVVEEARE